jgi:hypothetical protein
MRVSNWGTKILGSLLRSGAVGGLCALAIVLGTGVAPSPAGGTSPSAKSCEVPASTERIPPQLSGPAFTPD